MKHRQIFLFALLIFFTTHAYSQFTINSNNFPVGGLRIGRGYIVVNTGGAGNAGPNQYYDFTGIIPAMHDSIKYLPASQTPWASYHPGATVVNAETSGNITYVYYCTPTASAYSRTGLTLIGDFGQGPDTVHGNYSDPDVILSDQYTYGYNGTEYATASIPNILPLVNYQSKIKRNVQVDGWGQLETPLNYYPDVIRMKCTEYRYDTAFSFSTPVYTLADTQYYFNYYAKDVRHPVVKVHTNKLFNPLYYEYIYTPPFIVGCMDPLAVNYNPLANQPDGNCEYCAVNFTITPDTTICAGSSITLNITGGNTYLWSDGSTGNSITVVPAESTIYNAYVSSDSNCYALATVEVTVDKPVTAMFWTTLDHYNTWDDIQFVNLSSNATYYNWNFDDAIDGTSSLQYPTHTYTSTGMKYIVLTAYNSCYSDSMTDSIKINDGTFTNTYSGTDGMVLFPNPGPAYFVVQGNFDQPAPLDIYATDILGRKSLIASYKSVSGAFSIKNDMARFADGIYLIEIISGESDSVHKWIKIR